MVEQGALASRRILLVAEYYSSGGTRTYVRQLLELYRSEGASVTVVTTLEDADPEFEQVIRACGFELLTYQAVMAEAGLGYEGRPNVWSWPRWRQERRAFRRFAERGQFDTVVVSAGTPGMLLGSLWAGRNAVYILHTYPHGRRQDHLGRHYLSRMIPRGSRIVAVSQFENDLIEVHWRPQRRGASVTTILSTYGELATNRSSGGPPNTVLTVSLVEEYKRPIEWIALAVDVSARVPRDEVRFLWLGEGSLLESARQAADSVSQLADISFPGVSSDPSSAYEDCRVYLQYSSIENMSLAVIDALRHGIPSVVTQVGGLPEIVQDGVNGFVVDPSRPAEAARAVERLLTDTTLWHRLSEGAQRTYAERHSWSRWKSAMIAVHR